ncbi:MAG: TatD family hydrolase [Prolixibacteraceae bacterium]|nr:TatD family hydrolase [Prolixibacteraceae bacterium]
MIDYLDIHTHQADPENNRVFSLRNYRLPVKEIPPVVYFSAGWHPWDINNVPLAEIEKSLSSILASKNMLAIGECGLDRTIQVPIAFQTDVFMLHLKMALRHNKPVIVHCVKSCSDLVGILKSFKQRPKCVIHGFNGNRFEANNLIKFGCYLSFGKSIFSEKSKTTDVLPAIPLEKLFFETDDDDISIADIYLRATEILRIPLVDLIQQVKQNFNELMGYELA